MTADAVLRKEGMEALLDRLGRVDAERFITSIIREPFDYTEWQHYSKCSSFCKDLGIPQVLCK